MKIIIDRTMIILFMCVSSFSVFAQKTISDPSYTPYGSNPVIPMPLGKSTVSNFTNITIFSSSYHQTETSVTIDPNKANNLFVGANTVLTSNNVRIGGYYSTSSINTWNGVDEISSEKRFDPSVSYDLDGNLYYAYNYKPNTYVMKSTNNGANWGTPVKITSPNNAADKCFIATDHNANSPYKNNVYLMWTEFISNSNHTIYFTKSANKGQSFTTPIKISGLQQSQSAVCVVDKNGIIYISWSIYSPPQTTGIGFCKSTDGGVTFSNPTQISNVDQIGSYLKKDNDGRYRLKVTSINSRGVRVNSFPSMAVSPISGTLYIAWADSRFGSADIVLIKSTDGGSNWSTTPLKVNDDNTITDQWSPWVNVGEDSGVNIVFYDSRNDLTNNLLTEVFVARSIDQGQSFVNQKVSDMQFTPLPVPNLASGYMGDYIGITSSLNKVYPIWMDNRTGNYQIYTAEMNMQPVSLQYTVEQKLSNGTSVGVISKWNGTSFDPSFVPPKSFLFDVNSTQVLKGDQSIISNEKYNNWNNESNVINHHSFTIDANTTTFTSHFKPNKSGITIQNNLEMINYDAANDSVSFKDPWLIDYPDPNYANNKRNQGMLAPFKTRSAPFNPDYLTSHNGDVYQGIFLGQAPDPNDPNKPYYTVKAESPQPVTISGRNHTFYFQNWEASNNGADASFQNANLAETPVMFNNTGATVKAVMKGTQLSNTAAAFSNSGK